ncbi:MAG: hypothetical protein QNJ31_04320 [Candidatus Caenarcaniphilales bacterium]|nr:hypothetical protein [Candidatus Caenarcaniphilales bacterium]
MEIKTLWKIKNYSSKLLSHFYYNRRLNRSKNFRCRIKKTLPGESIKPISFRSNETIQIINAYLQKLAITYIKNPEQIKPWMILHIKILLAEIDQTEGNLAEIVIGIRKQIQYFTKRK